MTNVTQNSIVLASAKTGHCQFKLGHKGLNQASTRRRCWPFSPVANVADAMQDEADGRQRSSIGIPYNHLGDAIEVAKSIHDNAGTGDCDDVQLSAWMNMSPKSSGYRVQLSASRMFGLVETTASRHKLTPLGRSIVDPQQERAARTNAFLSLPLYKVLYDNYKGGVLPPAAALERDMVALGVAEKQTGRARQVFERSAEQANFFEHGKNRLVMPAVALRDPPPLPMRIRTKTRTVMAAAGMTGWRRWALTRCWSLC